MHKPMSGTMYKTMSATMSQREYEVVIPHETVDVDDDIPEPQLGTETWNRSLEPKLVTETWNRNLVPKLGTGTWNRNLEPTLRTVTLSETMSKTMSEPMSAH